MGDRPLRRTESPEPTAMRRPSTWGRGRTACKAGGGGGLAGSTAVGWPGAASWRTLRVGHVGLSPGPSKLPAKLKIARNRLNFGHDCLNLMKNERRAFDQALGNFPIHSDFDLNLAHRSIVSSVLCQLRAESDPGAGQTHWELLSSGPKAGL